MKGRTKPDQLVNAQNKTKALLFRFLRAHVRDISKGEPAFHPLILPKSLYYKADGFIEFEVGIDHDDLIAAIEQCLSSHSDFDFDECEIQNGSPFRISLTAKCRTYVDEEDPDIKADVETDEAYQDSDQLDGW